MAKTVQVADYKIRQSRLPSVWPILQLDAYLFSSSVVFWIISTVSPNPFRATSDAVRSLSPWEYLDTGRFNSASNGPTGSYFPSSITNAINCYRSK